MRPNKVETVAVRRLCKFRYKNTQVYFANLLNIHNVNVLSRNLRLLRVFDVRNIASEAVFKEDSTGLLYT